jgi:hypothetical protein
MSDKNEKLHNTGESNEKLSETTKIVQETRDNFGEVLQRRVNRLKEGLIKIKDLTLPNGYLKESLFWSNLKYYTEGNYSSKQVSIIEANKENLKNEQNLLLLLEIMLEQGIKDVEENIQNSEIVDSYDKTDSKEENLLTERQAIVENSEKTNKELFNEEKIDNSDHIESTEDFKKEKTEKDLESNFVNGIDALKNERDEKIQSLKDKISKFNKSNKDRENLLLEIKKLEDERDAKHNVRDSEGKAKYINSDEIKRFNEEIDKVKTYLENIAEEIANHNLENMQLELALIYSIYEKAIEKLEKKEENLRKLNKDRENLLLEIKKLEDERDAKHNVRDSEGKAKHLNFNEIKRFNEEIERIKGFLMVCEEKINKENNSNIQVDKEILDRFSLLNKKIEEHRKKIKDLEVSKSDNDLENNNLKEDFKKTEEKNEKKKRFLSENNFSEFITDIEFNNPGNIDEQKKYLIAELNKALEGLLNDESLEEEAFKRELAYKIYEIRTKFDCNFKVKTIEENEGSFNSKSQDAYAKFDWFLAEKLLRAYLEDNKEESNNDFLEVTGKDKLETLIRQLEKMIKEREYIMDKYDVKVIKEKEITNEEDGELKKQEISKLTNILNQIKDKKESESGSETAKSNINVSEELKLDGPERKEFSKAENENKIKILERRIAKMQEGLRKINELPLKDGLLTKDLFWSNLKYYTDGLYSDEQAKIINSNTNRIENEQNLLLLLEIILKAGIKELEEIIKEEKDKTEIAPEEDPEVEPKTDSRPGEDEKPKEDKEDEDTEETEPEPKVEPEPNIQERREVLVTTINIKGLIEKYAERIAEKRFNLEISKKNLFSRFWKRLTSKHNKINEYKESLISSLKNVYINQDINSVGDGYKDCKDDLRGFLSEAENFAIRNAHKDNSTEIQINDQSLSPLLK